VLMRPKRADLRLGGPQRGQNPVEHRGSEVSKLDRGSERTDVRPLRTNLRPVRAILKFEKAY